MEDIQSALDSVNAEINAIMQIRVSAEKIQDVIQQGPVYTNPGCEVYEVSLKELTAWNQALRTAYNLITKAP